MFTKKRSSVLEFSGKTAMSPGPIRERFLNPQPNIFIHLVKESPNTRPQWLEVETPPSKKYPYL